ncbi:MAG: hypothetical protein HUJ17_01205 [Alcanivorax sp.]|nr:hypothetical protein [Alcanivorax sp.]
MAHTSLVQAKSNSLQCDGQVIHDFLNCQTTQLVP